MKKVEAVIRHYKLDEVISALSQVSVQGMTVTDVRGFGRQRGQAETYRGAEYTIAFVPKVKIEIAVSDANLNLVCQTILRAAHTGQIGDGKLFVSELARVVRIRTGEKGEDAL